MYRYDNAPLPVQGVQSMPVEGTFCPVSCGMPYGGYPYPGVAGLGCGYGGYPYAGVAGYGCGYGGSFALIVVLFILLIIIGACCGGFC